MATRIVITRITDPDELGKQIEPHMVALGNAIAKRMQRAVPKRTWALHDTIASDTQRKGARVVTEVSAGGQSSDGSKVDYDQHVERGTSRMRAQPYMRPALLQSRAADLNFTGGSPARHGVIQILSKRARAEQQRANRRASAAQRKADRAEHEGES